jgi:hypothetical protein
VNKHVRHPFEVKLDRVLDRMGGLYLASDLLDDVKAGKKQMFALNDSIAVTQIANFPRGKTLEIIAAVGDIHELREMHERILEFAKSMDIKVIRAYGRTGFVEDAKKRGWTLKARSFVYQRGEL